MIISGNQNDEFDNFANNIPSNDVAINYVSNSFNKYKENYAQERDIEIVDSFTISDTAVKKQARVLKKRY